MNGTSASRRGFFARVLAAIGWPCVLGGSATGTSIATEDAVTTYSYDELGRLLSVAECPGPEHRTPKTEDLRPKT